jgi:hypothetical protein
VFVQIQRNLEEKQVLWIRICFNTDPDPAFYFSVDPPDPDSGSQTNANADLDPV